MRKAARLSVVWSFVTIVALFSEGRAQTKHVPTLEETLNVKTAFAPRISPDGRYVAYSVRETDWKDNEYVNQIWLAEVSTGRRFQLTRGRHSANGADWSPDSRWLAFVTEREAEAPAGPAHSSAEESESKPAAHQIWLISPEGGEAGPLTESKTDVGSFRWSKDGKKIAFTAAAPESKAMKDRKEKYSDYEVFEHDYKQNQLWVVDVTAGEEKGGPVDATQVTNDPALNVESFSWSPDSARIAFSATPNPLLAFSTEEDIYLLDLAHANAVRKIVALPGPDGDPVFSPDGKQIAFRTALGQEYDYYLNGHIASVDLERVADHAAARAEDVHDLTRAFDENVYLMDWGPDGIYFDALQRTAGHGFRLDPTTGRIRCLTASLKYGVGFGGLSLTKDFKSVAFMAEDNQHMGEVFVTALEPFEPRKLTDMNSQLSGFVLGTPEIVSWKSQDGTTIEGVLHKPADYDPTKRYPLLVEIHGGPAGVSQPLLDANSHYYPVQIFLSEGALVLEPNYRGSAGYGEKFRSLNVRNLGVGDMWDVMSGVDALIERGLVDANRLGAMGWSEGGYISMFLTTHTGRFKAISAGAGISDWMTYYVNTDITPFTRQYLHATPWDDPEIYAKTSPITTIREARTPTLIQQGSADKRVPVPDSFELYRGLQDERVPSRLVLYMGFGHGITKPKSNRAVLQDNLDWFNHYIWGKPIPKDSPLWGSGEMGQEK